MEITAKYLASKSLDKMIVLTGAMIPFSIEKSEAVANLSLAIYKAYYGYEKGVFIAMHGLVAPYNKIYKDKKRGLFCLR
jgi:L-asparaginase